MTDTLLDRRNFYINGEWVAPAEANDFEVIDPSTEQPCAVISLGGQADTDAAVAAAKASFPAWSATPLAERIEKLEALLDIYKARSGEMAEAISSEMGAPIALASTAQVGAGAGHIKSIIRELKNFEFERPLGDQIGRAHV